MKCCPACGNTGKSTVRLCVALMNNGHDMMFVCVLSYVAAADCLSCMQNGSDLIKVRSNSRQYHRFFTLDAECTEIRWQPSSKKASKARSKLMPHSITPFTRSRGLSAVRQHKYWGYKYAV